MPDRIQKTVPPEGGSISFGRIINLLDPDGNVVAVLGDASGNISVIPGAVAATSADEYQGNLTATAAGVVVDFTVAAAWAGATSFEIVQTGAGALEIEFDGSGVWTRWTDGQWDRHPWSWDGFRKLPDVKVRRVGSADVTFDVAANVAL